LGFRRMERMSINRILLLVAAAATAAIIAIYAALISTWSGANLACLVAFGAILLGYMFLLIRGDAMDLLA
jgi:hypothetical protein